MKVVIVEDEIAASDNLTYILESINPAIEVLTVIDSVSDAIEFGLKCHIAFPLVINFHSIRHSVSIS